MIGGWAAVQEVPVSVEFVKTIGESEAHRYIGDHYGDDWLILGPRGGRYIADANQVTVWQLDKEAFFHSDRWRFLGHRKTLRYVRPTSKDARRFDDRRPDRQQRAPNQPIHARNSSSRTILPG